MPFVIQSSTIPEAIGAGETGELHFNDLTHRLTMKGGKHVAVALATFGDGPELADLRKWAAAAHKLTDIEIEPFDATAEADRRQAEVDQEEADRLEAAAKAKAMIRDAKQDSAKLLSEARDQAAGIVDEAKAKAAKIVDEAKAKAADIEAKAAKAGAK